MKPIKSNTTPKAGNVAGLHLRRCRKLLLTAAAGIFLSVATAEAAPTVTNFTNQPTAVKYEKYELTFDLSSASSNPYDPNIYSVYGLFTAPSGKVYKQYAFYMVAASGTCTPYGANPAPHDKIETVTLNTGNQHWKIRFAAPETGTWTYRIIVDDMQAQNTSTTINYSFSCTNSANHGFVQLGNYRYMVYSDGTPFYPIGLSYPWFDRVDWHSPLEYGTCEMKQVMDMMASSKINFFRLEINIDMGIGLIGIDYRDNTVYHRRFNQKDAWQIDELIDYARAKGIYIEFALMSHKLLVDDNYGECYWNEFSPFNANPTNIAVQAPDVQGTCTSPLYFYSNAHAIQTMKNLARYVIGRWGYSTNLMSIELMDEADRLDALNALNTCNAAGWINPATQQSMLNSTMISWHQTMKAYFDQIDPFNHLVTTAFADDQHPAHSGVYQYMDFTQAHSYYSLQTYNTNIEKELFNETQLYCNYSASYNKPFVHGETYAFYASEAFGRQTDPHYYSMHASNWVSLMAGQFGTAKNWSALNFILSAPDAYNIYIGPGTFMAQQPLLSEQFIPNFRDDATRDIVFLQNINKDRMLGYIQDKNFKFNNIMWANNQTYRQYLLNFNVSYRPPLASATQTFSIPVVKNGEYDVTWYNSISGQQYSALVVATTNNQVTVTVPSALLNGKFGDAVFTINYKCENHWNTGPLNDHASQIARPYTPVAFDPNSDKVFYVGQDNRIHATWFENYFWNDGVLNPAAPANVAAKTDLVTDGQGVVYFAATDSRIHRTYWNGSAWLEEALNIGAPANVSSYSALQVNAAGTKVFFIGDDKRIHQMVKTGSTWTESTLNPAAPANVMLRSDLVYDESASRIFFAGSNYRIHAMTLINNGTWVEGDLNTSAPQNVRTYNDIANNVKYAYSSMALDPTNGNIFFVALDNRVHEYVKNGATWNEVALNSSAPANVRFSLGADYNYSMVADQQGKVFFFGTDNRVHQYYWNGTSWIEAANNILYDAQNAMSGLAASPGGEIYFAGSDWKMYSSYWGCNAKFRRLEPEENNAGEVAELPVTVSGQEQLKLYPNPAAELLNIELISGKSDEKMNVEVLDLSGRILINETGVPVQLAQLRISGIPAGVYIVRVTHNGVSQHARFVKQ